ncbi:hypothetical protein ACJX0J_038602, partial [Zea mays]
YGLLEGAQEVVLVSFTCICENIYNAAYQKSYEKIIEMIVSVVNGSSIVLLIHFCDPCIILFLT